MWEGRLIRQHETETLSREMMQNSNPVIIPRNHRVEAALVSVFNLDCYYEMELGGSLDTTEALDFFFAKENI